MRSKIMLYACICLVLSYLLAILAGYLFYNPRPFVEHHFRPLIEHEVKNGMPSHHALLVSSIAVIITAFDKKVSILFWALALLVGIARVYVGVHHVIDIVVSFLISISVGILIITHSFRNFINLLTNKLIGKKK